MLNDVDTEAGAVPGLHDDCTPYVEARNEPDASDPYGADGAATGLDQEAPARHREVVPCAEIGGEGKGSGGKGLREERHPQLGSDPARAFLNSTGYASAQFDAAQTRLSSVTDPVARKAAVVDALRLLANDAPVVPLFFQTGSFVFLPNAYDGWVFVKGTGIFDKRSFVDAGPAPPPPTSTTRPGSVVGPSSSVAIPPAGKSSDGLPIGLIGLGLIAVAAVIGVVTLIRR